MRKATNDGDLKEDQYLNRTACMLGIGKYLRGDCKPYPHNVKLINFLEHFSQKSETYYY